MATGDGEPREASSGGSVAGVSANLGAAGNHSCEGSMMKRFALALLFTTSLTPAAAQCDCNDPPAWQESFVSGDPVEATEVRQFVAHNGLLYAATGAWMDQ